jgi:hypothetical protein
MIFFTLLLCGGLLLVLLFVFSSQNSNRKNRALSAAYSAVRTPSIAVPKLSPKQFKELHDAALHQIILDSIHARLVVSPDGINLDTIQRAETFDRLYTVAHIFDVHLDNGGLKGLCDNFGLPFCTELAAAMECFGAQDHLEELNTVTHFFTPIIASNYAYSDSDKIAISKFEQRFRMLRPLSNYALNFARKNPELYCK